MSPTHLIFPNDPLVIWFFGVDEANVMIPFSLIDVVDKHDVDPLIFFNGESTSSGVSPKIWRIYYYKYLIQIYNLKSHA